MVGYNRRMQELLLNMLAAMLEVSQVWLLEFSKVLRSLTPGLLLS